MASLWIVGLLLVGCETTIGDTDDTGGGGNNDSDTQDTDSVDTEDTEDSGIHDTGTTVDVDGDGSIAQLDCDDADPQRHPGAADVPCDGLDHDCDGRDMPAADNEWAVFVTSGGSDTGAGTKADPLATIGAAISLAQAESKTWVMVEGGVTSTGRAQLNGISLMGGWGSTFVDGDDWCTNTSSSGYSVLDAPGETVAQISGDTPIAVAGVTLQGARGLTASGDAPLRLAHLRSVTTEGGLQLDRPEVWGTLLNIDHSGGDGIGLINSKTTLSDVQLQCNDTSGTSNLVNASGTSSLSLELGFLGGGSPGVCQGVMGGELTDSLRLEQVHLITTRHGVRWEGSRVELSQIGMSASPFDVQGAVTAIYASENTELTGDQLSLQISGDGPDTLALVVDGSAQVSNSLFLMPQSVPSSSVRVKGELRVTNSGFTSGDGANNAAIEVADGGTVTAVNNLFDHRNESTVAVFRTSTNTSVSARHNYIWGTGIYVTNPQDNVALTDFNTCAWPGCTESSSNQAGDLVMDTFQEWLPIDGSPLIDAGEDPTALVGNAANNQHCSYVGSGCDAVEPRTDGIWDIGPREMSQATR